MIISISLRLMPEHESTRAMVFMWVGPEANCNSWHPMHCMQENEIAKLRKRLEEADARCAEVIEENTELKREVGYVYVCPTLTIRLISPECASAT